MSPGRDSRNRNWPPQGGLFIWMSPSGLRAGMEPFGITHLLRPPESDFWLLLETDFPEPELEAASLMDPFNTPPHSDRWPAESWDAPTGVGRPCAGVHPCSGPAQTIPSTIGHMPWRQTGRPSVLSLLTSSGPTSHCLPRRPRNSRWHGSQRYGNPGPGRR